MLEDSKKLIEYISQAADGDECEQYEWKTLTLKQKWKGMLNYSSSTSLIEFECMRT